MQMTKVELEKKGEDGQRKGEEVGQWEGTDRLAGRDTGEGWAVTLQTSMRNSCCVRWNFCPAHLCTLPA